jgi:hypothetical protein
MPDAPRKARNPFKVAVSWSVGCVTDPHTRWSSAARIVGLMVATTLCAYVLIACLLLKLHPESTVIYALSALVIAALHLRAKSTQLGQMPSTQRAADRAPAPSLEPHED